MGQEWYFILNIIAGALSYGDDALQLNGTLNAFIGEETLPVPYDRTEQINRVSDILSTELLCIKFLQGFPLVSVIGGVADATFVNKILGYAKLKYKRRFLCGQMKQVL